MAHPLLTSIPHRPPAPLFARFGPRAEDVLSRGPGSRVITFRLFFFPPHPQCQPRSSCKHCTQELVFKPLSPTPAPQFRLPFGLPFNLGFTTGTTFVQSCGGGFFCRFLLVRVVSFSPPPVSGHGCTSHFPAFDEWSLSSRPAWVPKRGLGGVGSVSY